MTVAQVAVVNQRLYFCRLHLDWFKEQLSKEELPKQIVEQSLGESLVFHLVMAYRAYLVEIAESCSISNTLINKASDLVDLLIDNGHSCAAAIELSSLESVADSWLSDLLIRYDKLDIVVSKQQASNSISGIHVTQIDKDLAIITFDNGQKTFNALNRLIQQQRQQLQEW